MQIHYTGEAVTEIPVYLNDSNPDRPFAVLGFGPARVHVHTPDDAYKVIAAGIKALRLLDPDAPVQLADDVTAADKPERSFIGGLPEDRQSPGWTDAAAGVDPDAIPPNRIGGAS